MKTSFAPRDAGSGRWDGGPATITDPHFEYREVDFGGGRGTERIVACALTYLATDGGEHRTRFDVGNTQTASGDAILCVRASADDDADEAEIGPSFSHIDPDKEYKVSPKSEFFALTSALEAAGFPATKLATGDIGVIDGLEVIVKPKARKEGDRFPLLLPFELQQKAASPKKAGSSTAVKKAAAPPPPPVDEDEPELDAADEATRDFLLETVVNAGGVVPIAKIVTEAMRYAPFTADKKLKAAVIAKVQSADWYAQMGDYFVFDAKKKTVTATA